MSARKEGRSQGSDKEHETILPFRSSRPSEDLSHDNYLRNAATIEYEGEMRPTLARHVVLSKLGQGGMGTVYHAINPRLQTEVAIKVLSPSLTEGNPEMTERFVREARLSARFRSDNVVRVHDVDRDPEAGCFYIVMDYVAGFSADGWARWVTSLDGFVPEAEALAVAIAVARGVSALHREGIVHRDVKPSNVLIPLDDAGVPLLASAKVTDLGLAKIATMREGVTLAGSPMGSPGFMAPEQILDAASAGARADVYGIGATLFALLAGVAPVRGRSAAETMVRSAKGDTTKVEEHRSDVSERTKRLLDRALRTEPAERFADAVELLAELEACAAELGVPLPARRRSAPAAPSSARNLLAREPEARDEEATMHRGAPPVAAGPAATMSPATGASPEPVPTDYGPTMGSLPETPTGFFDASLFQHKSIYQGSQVQLTRVENALSFYRNHLDAELKTLRRQARTTYGLWVACVILGFLALISGVVIMIVGDITRGAMTAVATVLVYFIQKVFQQREDHYRAAVTGKEKHMMYANDWLVTMETIETMTDTGAQQEERQRVVSILSRKLLQHTEAAPQDALASAHEE